MMKINKKLCDGCAELRAIWKNEGGKKFCKNCWSAHKTHSNIKPTTKKQKRIPPRSVKRIAENLLYLKQRSIFLDQHPMCEAHLPNICTNLSTDVHHVAGRMGELFLDINNWKALCRACHSWVELHKQEAMELGLSKSKL